MRNLTAEEIELALDDNGESDDCIAIEGSIKELALRQIGTCCGIEGNTAFKALKMIFPDNASHMVRGWYDQKENTMCGMVHIQCENHELAEKISDIAYEKGNGGSLRPSGKSKWEGFYEFEIE